MAPLTPGTRASVLTDKIYWAPEGTVLPHLDRAHGAALPTGWKLIDDTQNGMAVTCRMPRVAYRSEERGRIANLLGDDDGIALGFADQTPTWELAMQVSNFVKVSQAAVPASPGPPAVPGYPAADIWHQDPSVQTNVMVMFEGVALPGTLFDEETLIWGVAYSAQQTANVSHVFRQRGADSPFRIVASMECLPYPIQTAQTTGTGISPASLDPLQKFDYFVVEQA